MKNNPAMNEQKKSSVEKVLVKYMKITLAAALYGVSIALFLDPLSLAPGGFSGIAIILNRVVPLGTGAWFLILNIPVLLLALWQFGWRFLVSTLYATVLSGVFTDFITARFSAYVVTDMILAVVFGSLLMALALGITFLCGATTGGSDIIVKLLRRKYPHIKTGRLYFLFDMAVVAAAGLVFRNARLALYALISVFLIGYMLDVVLYGRDSAKLLYIISDHAQEIADRILKELDIGATFMEGKGAFSGTPKQVILCVVKKRVYPHAEEIVKEEDPDAFLIVSGASEIFGEGYKDYFDERL